ncbi:hypothetical protein TVAG_411770 [Trichomonas vaginalis G3]|uniref:SCP domain-containing protein n=1 Tax=Trichomonas vaginalis (strain ATCC PRA-98 / G3) TaxID=412133 RepID=A2FB85_TRIV3|nr:protein-related family [Trichomonas vaginalis G3]EAX97815.1 hypothetical protein TVAG_411770 [Trichomonas vaginalis G3]KAI5490347.1 protein-related family [Trichomonas vaginalis G3]|eukprot:XP_001310745.1 hypothetical protein [Trichomonas vaginalis G3]
MSRREVPFGHANYLVRESQVPLALAFSENVATCDACDDPGKAVMLYWLKKSSCFSRIQGEYTHTGIGVAENTKGQWFCTQIFATFKTKISKKDGILVMSRYVNNQRRKNNLPPLIITISPCSRLLQYRQSKSSNLSDLNTLVIKNSFENCVEANFIFEKVAKTDICPLEDFLKALQENKAHSKTILKDYTHVSFVFDSISEKDFGCALLFAKCNPSKVKIPHMYAPYPNGAKMLLLLNDYRSYKGIHPVIMSLQWCEISQMYCDKLHNEDIDLETRKVKQRIHKLFPMSRANVGIYLTPWTPDPLQEIFLMWISNLNTKLAILDPDFNVFGFGIAFEPEKYVYSTRVIGFRSLQEDKVTEEMFCMKNRFPYQLGNLTSDDDDDSTNCNVTSFVQLPNFPNLA